MEIIPTITKCVISDISMIKTLLAVCEHLLKYHHAKFTMDIQRFLNFSSSIPETL